jgi:hypothetical protein
MTPRALLAAALLVGCPSASGPPPETRLEVHAVPMIVEECDGSLSTWTLHIDEIGRDYTARATRRSS